MAEAGVDISQHRSKAVAEVQGVSFDYIVTVCSQADRDCPVFPGPVKKLHRGFDDPPTLARQARSEEEALTHYRRVRDKIRDFVEELPGWLEQQ
jgi:arsenate reductase